MKPHIISLLNGIVLVLMGTLGFLGNGNYPITALIPVFVGMILIGLNKGVKNQNKIVAHIAVLLTLIMLLGLFKPLIGTIERGNYYGIFRSSSMILVTFLALITFIKSFIALKKERQMKEKELEN